MEQKVIQNEQIKAAGFLQALLEFGVQRRESGLPCEEIPAQRCNKMLHHLKGFPSKVHLHLLSAHSGDMHGFLVRFAPPTEAKGLGTVIVKTSG